MKTALLVAAVLIGPTSALPSDVRLERGPSIKAIELWAASSERPGPMRIINKAWSSYDFRDSVVVRAVVDAGNPTPKALLLADVQFLAARRVWTDKSHETVDPDRTQARAVWLPASAAFEIPLSNGHHAPNGNLLLDLGVVSPERVLVSFHSYDPELLVVGLRITARLIGKNVSTTQSTVRQIDLSFGD